ncbi:hypothetical protein FJT64_007225 [Amphibalanus amphitrite]|uniref:Uncharacterized protein n=1 Tax=Amphibalanus amphitrite TaxID=1232801 RepID=A0A6A4VFJ5_AMPAM|nr:hypothetical protein FJT64_007225 [Amphibalanus amphitrite]
MGRRSPSQPEFRSRWPIAEMFRRRRSPFDFGSSFCRSLSPELPPLFGRCCGWYDRGPYRSPSRGEREPFGLRSPSRDDYGRDYRRSYDYEPRSSRRGRSPGRRCDYRRSEYYPRDYSRQRLGRSPYRADPYESDLPGRQTAGSLS